MFRISTVYLSALVCHVSKPWEVVYDIMTLSTTIFSANISWRAPNNTYEREIIRYIVSVGIEQKEKTGIQSVDFVSCLYSLLFCCKLCKSTYNF